MNKPTYEEIINHAKMNSDCGEHMSPAEIKELVLACEAQVKQLAAENAALSKDAQRYRFIRERDLFGSDNEPGLLSWEDLTELECNDFDDVLDARLNHPTTGFIELDSKLQALKTAATDAILASLRAEAMADGVIALADKVESLPYFVGVKQQFIRNFAARLRSKSEVQS